MYVDLIPLSKWIEQQYKDYPSISPKQQKEEEADNLGVSISTIYNWLRSGDVYIQLLQNGEDGPSIAIWEMKKICEN